MKQFGKANKSVSPIDALEEAYPLVVCYAITYAHAYLGYKGDDVAKCHPTHLRIVRKMEAALREAGRLPRVS